MKRTLILALAAVSASSFSTLGYWINDSTDTLMTMDTVTLATTTVGALGTGGDFGDLAWDAATSTMYLSAGRGNNSIYTVDLSTGVATLVGSHGITDMFGLGLDSSTGKLYGSSGFGNDLWDISKTTGAATLIANGGNYGTSLTYNNTNNTMFMLEAGTGSVFSVDLTTGANTLVKLDAFINDAGWDYDETTDTYFGIDWSNNAFRWDSSFNRTFVGTGFGSSATFEFANPIPEPGTMALLGLGALALVRKRRKN